MEQLLQGILQVTVYIDDILIHSETEAETLEEVFKRLAKAKVKVKKPKCKFMVPSVPHHGHVIEVYIRFLRKLKLFTKLLLMSELKSYFVYLPITGNSC